MELDIKFTIASLLRGLILVLASASLALEAAPARTQIQTQSQDEIFLAARAAVAVHWGTFKLTDEPRDDPTRRLAAGLAAKGLAADAFIALHPAQSADFERHG